VVGIDFTVTGGAEWVARLRAATSVLDDFSKPRGGLWALIVRYLVAQERERFDTEGYRQWQPNCAKYAAIKAKKFPGRKIMELYGPLRASLTEVDAAPGAVRVFSPHRMTFGTNIRYAATHHYGSNKRMWIPAPFNMWIDGVPRRRLIEVDAKMEDAIRTLAEGWIISRMVRAAGAERAVGARGGPASAVGGG
jgi:hypothetical protein